MPEHDSTQRLKNQLEVEPDDVVYDWYLDEGDRNRKAFYTKEELPDPIRRSIEILEENFSQIRDEILEVDETNLQEWVEKDIYTSGWSVLPLYTQTDTFPRNIALCPNTNRVIDDLRRTAKVMSVGFSYLFAGAHILPHNGYVGYSDKVVRVHLPLVVPEGKCGLHVGNIRKSLKEGRCIVFDDSVTHQAWNFTGKTRIVLVIDFEHLGKGGKNYNLDHYTGATCRLRRE